MAPSLLDAEWPQEGAFMSINALQRTHSRVTPLAEESNRRATRRAAERERWPDKEMGE
jgi:hypothetical protein